MISRCCTFPPPNYDDLTPEEKQKFGKLVNLKQGYDLEKNVKNVDKPS
jgi:hypothetical protein